MKRVYNVTGDVTDKFINKKMVEWDNNYSYVNLPIAMIVGIMYGQLKKNTNFKRLFYSVQSTDNNFIDTHFAILGGISDVHGRKIPLLIGIGSCVIENASNQR